MPNFPNFAPSSPRWARGSASLSLDIDSFNGALPERICANGRGAEVGFPSDDLKSSQAAAMMRRKSPAMVRRDLVMHAIACNIIRRLMLESAITFEASLESIKRRPKPDQLLSSPRGSFKVSVSPKAVALYRHARVSQTDITKPARLIQAVVIEVDHDDRRVQPQSAFGFLAAAAGRRRERERVSLP